MGLDMFIFKMKRFGKANLDDVYAVESWLGLQRYKKEHPEYTGDMQDWCGRDKPSDKLIEYYSKFEHKGMYDNICISDEVAYWRKANAVHQWFVDNVQNGEDDCAAHRELTITDLETLKDLAQQVIDNPDLAEELLPTQPGFFFGTYDYGEWYMEGLQQTVDQIDRILETTDFNTEALYYVSSW